MIFFLVMLYIPEMLQICNFFLRYSLKKKYDFILQMDLIYLITPIFILFEKHSRQIFFLESIDSKTFLVHKLNPPVKSLIFDIKIALAYKFPPKLMNFLIQEPMI